MRNVYANDGAGDDGVRVMTRIVACSLWFGFLFAIGPLWFAPNDVHDGLMGTFGIATHDFRGIELWLLESNWWLMLDFYRAVAHLDAMGSVPYWVSYKVWMSIFCAMTAREAYLYAHSLLGFPRWAAWYAAAMVFVFPVWSMLFASVQMVIVFVWLVLWGHRQIHSNLPWRQIVGWVAVLASFQLNSNFAFVLGLESVRWWLHRQRGDASVSAWPYRKSLALALVAIASYLATRFWLPPRGEYAGYNNLLTLGDVGSWVRLVLSEAKFLTWLCLPLSVWVCALVLARKHPRSTDRVGLFDVLTVWLCVGVLFVSATAPYALVGKGTALFFTSMESAGSTFSAFRVALGDSGLMSPWGIWSNRFVLHLAVPLSLLGAAGAVWAHSVWQLRPLPMAGVLLAPWLVSATLLLQAHGTKLDQMAVSESIVNGLKTVPVPSGGRLDIEVTPAQRFIYPEAHDPNWLAFRAWGESRWLSVLYYGDGTSEKIVRDLAAPQYAYRANNPPRGAVFGATDYKGESCTTYIKLDVGDVGRWEMLRGLGYRPETARPAKVLSTRSNCP